MFDEDKQLSVRAFQIGFIAVLLAGVVANVFVAGVTVDAAVTGLGIGIAAVVSVTSVVAAIVLALAVADRWVPGTV